MESSQSIDELAFVNIMLTTERHFRIAQVFCMLVVLACVQLAVNITKTSSEITVLHWVLMAMAAWAMVSGFTLQRKIISHSDRDHQRPGRSTPLSRWRAGNLVRIGSATSVALWGLILRENGGPALIAYILFAVAGLLLAIWKPGRSPVCS
jgi:uncharacterized membrane protein